MFRYTLLNVTNKDFFNEKVIRGTKMIEFEIFLTIL